MADERQRRAEEKLAKKMMAARLRLQSTHFVEDLDNGSCIVCLRDGRICVSDTGNHRLLILSAESGEILAAIPAPVSAEKGTPQTEETPQAGDSFVPIAQERRSPGDRSASPTSAPRREGGRERRWSTGSSSADSAQLRGPRGLAADDSAVYVADCYNSRIKKFSLITGELIGVAGGYGDGDGKLRYPYGLALSPTGILYVADCGNARISAFSTEDMSFTFSFEMQRDEPSQEASVAEAPSSNPPPLSPSSNTARIATGGANDGSNSARSATGFSTPRAGTPRAGTPRAGTPRGGGTPRAVMTPRSSNPLLVKWGPRYLATSSPMLRSLKSAGIESPFDVTDSAQLSIPEVPAHHPRAKFRPSGLAVLKDEIFVCDAYSRRLQVFTLRGEFRRYLQPVHLEGTELGKLLLINPQGVGAAHGRIFVSDRRGDALYMLDLESGKSVQHVPFLVNRPRGLSGVSVDGNGRVYVIDEMKNELHMLSMLQEDGPNKTGSGGLGMPATPSSKSTPRSASNPASARSSGSGTPKGTDPISAAMNG